MELPLHYGLHTPCLMWHNRNNVAKKTQSPRVRRHFEKSGGNLMGIVKKVANTLTGGLLGGKQPKAPTYKPPKSTPTTTKSAVDIAAQEEEERRKRLLALNAGGDKGQLTPAGGDTSTAPVARKTLLGQ